MHRKAFSLIELLVVIAIVGLLATTAVPAYNTYQMRVKVEKSLIILNAIAKDAQVYYSRKGVYPPSVAVNGVTIPNISWAAVNYGDIASIGYQSDTSGIMLHAVINGIGTANTASYAVKDIGNGVTQTACGQYSSADTTGAVPFSYFPSSCTCRNVLTFYTNGTGC